MAKVIDILSITVMSTDLREGVGTAPAHLVLNTLEHERPLYVPAFSDAEFDEVDRITDVTIPEDGLPLKLTHWVNDNGYDEYRVITSVKAKAKSARERARRLQAARAQAHEE